MSSTPLAFLVTVLLAAEAPVDGTTLANLVYRDIYDQPIALTEGHWEGEPFEDGGASRPSVRLAPLGAHGDLDADGADESVVLLLESSGGSGSYTHLAIVDRVDAEPANTATILLGDRLQIRSLRVENGYVKVAYLAAGPDEPACCPTQKVRKTLGLTGDQIVEVFSEELGPISAEDLEELTWRLTHFDRHEASPRGVEITAEIQGRNLRGSGGCNRYFTTIESLEARELRIGPVASTRIACPPAQTEAELRFFTALETVEQFGFSMGQLALRYNEGGAPKTLLFSAVPSP